MHSRHSSSAVLVTLLALVGCAPSNPSVDIEGIAAPSDDCGFAAGETFALSARLDTSSASLELRGSIQYVAALQVANRIRNGGNYVYPLMADPNVWIASEAEVELRGVDGQALGDLGLPARYRVPVSGTAISSAGGVDEPGRGIVIAEVIPAVYGDALADREGTIVVAVRLTGTTTGDSTQQTGEYAFPLTLCNDCLRTCRMDPLECIPPEPTGCLSLGQDNYEACLQSEIQACIDAMPPPVAP